MCSYLKAEFPDNGITLQKVSGSQIAEGVSSEMVVRLFWWQKVVVGGIIK